MNLLEYLLIITCAAFAAALVFAEWRNWPTGRVIFKIAASTAFVLLALTSGAAFTVYGRLLLAALLLSWLGDVLLLSKQNKMFLAGIAAFLLAHVAFALAFVSLPLSFRGVQIGMIAMTAVGTAILYWLRSSLSGVFRFAVPAYVAAIVIMAALAAGASSESILIPTGAFAFAASDISVARDRFVSPGIGNRVWGLPLYYAAQMLLALSAASVSTPA